MNDLLLPAIQKSTSQDLDPYYNLVSLHLKGDVNTGRNYNAFSDASSNNFRLTNSGDVRGSSFSPYGTSWSGFFGGGYITVPSGSAVTPTGTQSYCLEFFAYITGFSGTYDIFVEGSTNTNGFQIAYFNDGGASQGKLGVAASGVGSVNTATITGYLNKWVHVVATRSGNDHRLFFDGVLVAYASNAISFGARGTQAFGAQAAGTLPIDGYMSNIRVCLDAIPTSYQTSSTTVGTSVFSAVTSPLTTSSQGASSVALITCHANRFIDRDNGTGTVALALNGTLRISSFSPFLETDTTSGSGYFDGTGDYLQTASNAAFDLGTGNFTLEFWVNPTGISQTFITRQSSASGWGNIQWYLTIDASGTLVLAVSNGSTAGNLFANPNIPRNAWSHVAIVRNTNVWYVYLNGVSQSLATGASYSSSMEANATGQPVNIGGFTGWGLTTGNIADVRLVKGVPVYTGNFTPPTKPLSRSGSASASAYPSTTNVNTTFAESATSILTLQERGAYNTIGFQDESEYQHIITRSGNVAQGTFSPFSNAGWGNYFVSASSQYLSLSSSSFAVGTGAFTIEGWVYLNSYTYGSVFSTWNGANTGVGMMLGFDNTGKIQFSIGNASGSADTTILTASPISLNTWVFLQATKAAGSGGAMTIYINGTSSATTTTTRSIDRSAAVIGRYYQDFSGNQINGYLSNVRVSNTVRSSTVPIAPFINDANTLLLTCQSNRFIDNSTNNFTITPNGSPTVQAFSPFKPPAYDPQVHGGSGYFDGTGDYLTIVDNSAFTLANYNFCIELWIYPTASMANYANFLGQWANSTTNCAYTFRTSVSQNVQFAYTTSGNGQAGTTVDGSALVISSWNHIVVCRNGTTLSIFQNGVRTATHNISTNTISDSSRDQQIGFGTDGSAITGYMSSLRFVTGNSIYDPTLTSITVPSGPLPILPNTGLLLNFTNAGVIDSTGKNVIETVGNAGVVTTAIKKYGTGSMYFDGTGDSLTIGPNQLLNIGSGDFTIEFWVYPTGGSLGYPLYSTTSRAKSDVLAFELTTSGSIGVYITQQGGGAWSIASGTIGTLTLNAWSHVALVRSGTSIKGYINGVLGGVNVTSSAAIAAFDGWNVGTNGAGSGYFPGNLDDVRITRGYARYTANFTAPTKAHPDRGTLSTLTADLAAPSSVEALVVAGGASGAKSGNGGSPGGGAGGYIEHPSFAVSSGTSYNITIGAGGAGSAPAAGTFSSNDGNQTLFGSLTAIGGGGSNKQSGNTFIASGRNGGSGGGTGNISSGSGAAGSGTQPSQPGASGTYGFGNSGAQPTGGGDLGGGGGGAGGAAPGVNSGNGGAGKASSITGISRFYAGGGGSGAYGSGAVAGAGGSAIGGDGVANGSASAASGGSGSKDGAANTGSGGGGSWSDVGGSGSGGSGVVILAYPTSFRPLKASLGLVYTIDTVTRPGYRVYKFTAGTGTVSW